MTEQERREHFAFLNGVAADMKESRKEIIELLEGIKAEIKGMEIVLDKHSMKDDKRTDEQKAADWWEMDKLLVLNAIDRHIKEYKE